MGNPNYLRGRRLEWYFCKLGRQHGWKTARTAGSHGFVDVIWWRMAGLGSVNEAFEHIKGDRWFPMPDLSQIPDDFTYGFFRYTRGLNKQYIWVLPVADGYSQCLLIQVKQRKLKKQTA